MHEEGATRRVDAILFDADGVIQRAQSDIRLRLAAVLGAAPDDVELCMSDIFDAEAPALVGGCDFADALSPVLSKWDSRAEPAALLAEWLTIDVDRSVLNVIGALRLAGVRCALASNQERRRASHMSVALAYGEAFDRDFYSWELGCKKPSPEYFAAIIRLWGCDPARTLFIDDRAGNVEAARAAGLVAAQFVLGEIGAGAAPMRALLAQYGL